MNYRRSNLLPRSLALLAGLCILVSTVAYAPGWVNGPKHAAADTVSTIEPAAVFLEPAVPVLAVSIAANQNAPDTVVITDDANDPLALSLGFDTEAMASLVAQRGVDEAFFDDLQQIASNGSAIGSDSASPIRLAMLEGRSIRSPGGGGAARSSDSKSTDDDSEPDATTPAGGSDSNKHTDHTGEDFTPIESESASSPEVPADEPDSTGPGAEKPDPVPPPTDPAEFIPIDPWPIDQLPIDASAAEPVSVPEPGTLGLFALGLASIAGARRRRAQRSR